MDLRRSRLAMGQQQRPASPIPRIDFMPLVRDAAPSAPISAPQSPEVEHSGVRLPTSTSSSRSNAAGGHAPLPVVPREGGGTPNSTTARFFPVVLPASSRHVATGGGSPSQAPPSSGRRGSPRASDNMNSTAMGTVAAPHDALVGGRAILTAIPAAPSIMLQKSILATTTTRTTAPAPQHPEYPPAGVAARTGPSNVVSHDLPALCSAVTAPTSPWTLRFEHDDMEECFCEHFYNFRRVTTGVLIFLGVGSLSGVGTGYQYWNRFNLAVQIASAIAFLGGTVVMLLTRRPRSHPISLPSRFVGSLVATSSPSDFEGAIREDHVGSTVNRTAQRLSSGGGGGGIVSVSVLPERSNTTTRRSRHGSCEGKRSLDDKEEEMESGADGETFLDPRLSIRIREIMLLLCHCMIVLTGIGNVTYQCGEEDEDCRLKSTPPSIESESTLFVAMLVAVSFAPARCFLMVPIYILGALLLFLLYYVPGDHAAVPYRSTDAVMFPFVILMSAETLTCLGIALAREWRRRQSYRHHVERQRRRLEAQRVHEHLRQVTAVHLPIEFLSHAAVATPCREDSLTVGTPQVHTRLHPKSSLEGGQRNSADAAAASATATVTRLWVRHKSARGIAIVVGLTQFNEWATSRGPADVVSLMRFVHHHVDSCVDSALFSGRANVRCLKAQGFGDEVRLMVLPLDNTLQYRYSAHHDNDHRRIDEAGGSANPLELNLAVGTRGSSDAYNRQQDIEMVVRSLENKKSVSPMSSSLSSVRRAGVGFAAAIVRSLSTYLDRVLAESSIAELPPLPRDSSMSIPADSERALAPFVVAAEGTCRYRWNPVTNSVVEFGPAMDAATTMARKRMQKSTWRELEHPLQPQAQRLSCAVNHNSDGLLSRNDGSGVAVATPALGCLILRVDQPSEVLSELNIAEDAAIAATTTRYLSLGVGETAIGLRIYSLPSERYAEDDKRDSSDTADAASPPATPPVEPVAVWIGVVATSPRIASRDQLIASTSSGAISGGSQSHSQLLPHHSGNASASVREVVPQVVPLTVSPNLRQHLDGELRHQHRDRRLHIGGLDGVDHEVEEDAVGEEEYEHGELQYADLHQGHESHRREEFVTAPNEGNNNADHAGGYDEDKGVDNDVESIGTASLSRRGSREDGVANALEDAFSRAEEHVALHLAYGVMPFFPYRPLEDEYKELVSSYASTSSPYDLVLSSLASIISLGALLAANQVAGTPGIISSGSHTASSSAFRPELWCICGIVCSALTLATQLFVLPRCSSGSTSKSMAAYALVAGVYVTHVWFLLAVFLSPRGTVVGNTQVFFVYIAASWSLSRPMMGLPISVLISYDAFVGALLLLRTTLYLQDTRSSTLYPTCLYIPGVSAMWLLREYARRDAFAMEKLVELIRREIELDYERLEKALDVMVPAGVAGSLVQRVRRQHLAWSKQYYSIQQQQSNTADRGVDAALFTSSARSQRNAIAAAPAAEERPQQRLPDVRDFIRTGSNTSSSFLATANIHNASTMVPSFMTLHPLRSGSGNLQTKDVPFFLILRDRCHRRVAARDGAGSRSRSENAPQLLGDSGVTFSMAQLVPPVSSPFVAAASAATQDHKKASALTATSADGTYVVPLSGLGQHSGYASLPSMRSTAQQSSNVSGGVSQPPVGGVSEPWQAVICRAIERAGSSGVGGGVHVVQCTERCLLVACAANGTKELATVSARCTRLLATLDVVRKSCFFREQRDVSREHSGSGRDGVTSLSSLADDMRSDGMMLDARDFRVLADVGPLMGATAGLSRMVFGFFGGRVVSALSALEALENGLSALNVDLLDYVANRPVDLLASPANNNDDGGSGAVEQRLLSRRWCHRDQGIPKRYYNVEPLLPI